MVDLVCIDVDGTLVGSGGEPTPAVWAAAAAAVARGQHLAVCTARPALGPTLGYARRLDPAGWHIFHNGAALVHTGGLDPHTQPLGPDQVAACADLARSRDHVLEHYTVDDYAVDSDAPLAVAHAALLGVAHRRRPVSVLAAAVVRVQFVVPVDEVAAVIAATPAGTEASAATSPVMPGAAFVSVTRAGVSKAQGVLAVAARLGVPPDRVMVVGDGHNDAPAMAAVRHGVAMGNADEACRAAARHHVASVDDDGLAEALALAAILT